MMCMMRVVAQRQVVWMEFSVLRQTTSGTVLDTRFFDGDMKPSAPIMVQLRLKSATANELIFENPAGSEPKLESITRVADGEMNSHADLVDSKHNASAIDVHWKRVQ
jgi:hypothetical protein